MKFGVTAALAVVTTTLASSGTVAQTTIAQLQQQNRVTVSGDVVKVWGDEFILRDKTGELFVEAETLSIRQANLKSGDRISVTGRYDDDSFEAMSITTAGGKTVYVFDD